MCLYRYTKDVSDLNHKPYLDVVKEDPDAAYGKEKYWCLKRYDADELVYSNGREDKKTGITFVYKIKFNYRG